MSTLNVPLKSMSLDVERMPGQADAKPEKEVYVLPEPQQLPQGSIVTLRMRGHSRTNGQEYYAPAVVLAQYANITGDIEVLIWDSTAGTHYNAAYPVRDLSTRGDGAERETYELRSNIGKVLFDPEQFEMACSKLEIVDRTLTAFARRLERLEGSGTAKSATPTIASPAVRTDGK